jgi:membrane protein
MGANHKSVLEAGGSEVTTGVGGARRYRKPLKDFRWYDIKSLIGESFSEWNKHKAPRLGASLAFYTLLSLMPLLLVVVSVVGLVFGRNAAEGDVVEEVQSLVGPQSAQTIQTLLEGSQNTEHGIIATAVGSLTLLFSASAVMIELQDALNTIWEVVTPDLAGLKKITSFFKERLFSFALVLSVSFVLVVSLALSVWIAALGTLFTSVLPAREAVLHSLNALISFIITTGLFSAIYKVLPEVRLEWRDVILGGAVTSLLFTVGKLALGLYLGKATFASTYGAAASIVVLIVWVYYSSQIFFFGAEFTKAFAHRHGSNPSEHPERMVVDSGDNTRVATSQPKLITPSGSQ